MVKTTIYIVEADKLKIGGFFEVGHAPNETAAVTLAKSASRDYQDCPVRVLKRVSTVVFQGGKK